MSLSQRLSHHLGVAALLLMTSYISPGETLAAQLSLTWADSSINDVGFAIERGTETADLFAEIAETGPGVTAYVDTTVADGTTYCYRVRAFNTAAYSDYSNMACGVPAQALGLTVVKMGAGSGTVISTPSGIICGATCSGTFPADTPVSLTATTAAGSTFSGWSGGGCTGTGPCTVTLTSTTTVVATFAMSQSVDLTVSTSGTGSGTVSSTPAGIICGTTCLASYSYGTSVTLTAVVPAGSTFTAWSGGCTGAGSCTVSLTSATSVTASFTLQSVILTVAKAGTGTGAVSSSPSGIDCGTTCTGSYGFGSTVTLAAVAPAGSTFTGWSGACSGSGSCRVTLSSATKVTARFTQQAKPRPSSSAYQTRTGN